LVLMIELLLDVDVVVVVLVVGVAFLLLAAPESLKGLGGIVAKVLLCVCVCMR
jgi:hypothetical protein